MCGKGRGCGDGRNGAGGLPPRQGVGPWYNGPRAATPGRPRTTKGTAVSEAFYVTTPIYYVNANPHLGHAYTTILADVLTRFHRADGRKAFFQTGTDEHGEKIAVAAAAKGMTPQAFTDEVSGTFRELWKRLQIEPSNFVRTTDEAHKTVVRAILTKVHEAGDIYFDHYDGLYCLGCERYMTDKDLVDGKCPDHDREPEKRSESNWFFRMEKYREWLRQYVLDNPDFVQPEGFRKETLALLEQPIGDLSISRPKERVPWGIPIPWDEGHVTYVWFDALINYVSGLGWPDGENFATYWPVSTHLIAKDILKPHCIFWPCMLKAAGIDPYHHIRVHGYWLTDEGKMSKSRGNVVKPLDLVDTYGNDAFRYFLMRDITFGRDATFSELALAERVNADLANDLGNLLHRTIGMVGRYHDGVIKGDPAPTADDEPLRAAAVAVAPTFRDAVSTVRCSQGIEAVLEVVRATNKYIDSSEPWRLAKDSSGDGRLQSVLYTCVEVLRITSTLLDCVMPWKMAELRRQLGLPGGPVALSDAERWGLIEAGTRMVPGEPLFPRIDLHVLRTTLAGDQAPKGGAKPEKKKTEKKPKKSSEPETPAEIAFEDFWKVKLVVVAITACETVEGADKLLRISCDAGTEGTPTVVAGLAPYYRPDELVGRRALWVANLAPRTMRGVVSQGMLLAADLTDGGVRLVQPAVEAAPGTRIH